MHKKWSGIISLLVFLLVGQQVFSSYAKHPKLLAQYTPNNPNICFVCGNNYCIGKLADKTQNDVLDHCVNTNNYPDWCCACFPIDIYPSYNPPSQCQPLWDALSGTPVITNTPTLTPTPTNSPPNAPVLLNPPSGTSNVGIFPNFTLYSTDYEQNNLQYRIFLCKNGNNCQSFDSSSYSGWSKTYYSSGEQASCSLRNALELNTTYYWRALATDSHGATSSDSTTYSFRTIPPTPTNTPTPTPIPVSDVGSGGFSSGGAGSSYYISTTFITTPTPTPIRQLPTPTPPSLFDELIHTFTPTSTPIPTPTRTPTRTPTQAPNTQTNQNQPPPQAPTATPTPDIPSSLTKSTTTTQTKQVNEINKDTVSKITIKPVVVDTRSDKTLLPDEQTLVNESIQNSGNVTVTLEGKNGQQFSTQGNEFIIKRTNQLVSIKTQDASTTQKTTASKTPAPQLEINSNNVVAHSNLTLSIDPLSGILTVDTPNGPQKVSIMPDEALGIVTELNAIDKNQGSHDILLSADKGRVTYRIEGNKTEKFIGIFPLPLDKIISLSADTGGIIKISSTTLGTLLGLFTF